MEAQGSNENVWPALADAQTAEIVKSLEEKTTPDRRSDLFIQICDATPDIMESNTLDKLLWAERLLYLYGFHEALSIYSQAISIDEDQNPLEGTEAQAG